MPRVRRRAVACARCRTRKVMCDGATPSCSKCTEAGTPCVASGASSERTVPRSIVLFLEEELAKTEALCEETARNDGCSTELVEKVIKDMTPSFLGLMSKVPLVPCAVAGTRLPSTTDTADSNDSNVQSEFDPEPNCQPSSALLTIPISVADFLFHNYMTRVVPIYPIFYSADLVAYFNAIFHPASQSLPTPREIYVVSLIMAISLTTAARTQQVRANSIARALFKEAMQQIRPVYTNDIAGLQSLLLLVQYTYLDPSAANLWLLSGFATQACIDLGLHRESLDQTVDALSKDIRRRVFWCTYEMEIAISAALLRPSLLFSTEINVPFPTKVDDSSISASGIDLDGPATKFCCRWIWQFRLIEAEIISVLFPSGDPVSTSLESWMDEIESRINHWHQEIHWSASLNTDSTMISQWEEMSLYADIARNYIIVTLFRPSPRIPEPTPTNLMKAFLAGVGVAEGYWQQYSNLGFGNSKYVFHPCHHTFAAGIVFMRSLQRCKETISASYTLNDVEGFIACFSRLFATIAERWPGASRCLEEFERLVAPVKREYIDYTVQKARNISQDPLYDGVTFEADPTLISERQLDNANFEPLFAPGIWDQESAGAYTVPMDWTAEFGFSLE
ncbi:hypothetical protein ASPVEDRAFT_81104 [Aspergillus versicolor CBS 583.65]|uniref:Zn(2)-C6 fungal-type domain-containing protein n=1 Tax=Aspergillus versicolor CBS 583.65 TaxID=1036611 RepID=A0A1L9PDC4_ASPVE|nr:uncharacterized protein ASPVEDRAFT_81104 [Aspergillus versicolor CBS 583.65]OJI99492.1 hypothetical protein ASPVEDRAFT_81104 [Aspergillus versicolor CBS 583.65]